MAKLAIERMEDDLEEGSGKSNYWDYISVLNKYHIPYFDNTYITSIDHNAALNRVFDEAEIRRWITTSQSPTLTTKGGLGAESKGAFTKEEVMSILLN